MAVGEDWAVVSPPTPTQDSPRGGARVSRVQSMQARVHFPCSEEGLRNRGGRLARAAEVVA